MRVLKSAPISAYTCDISHWLPVSCVSCYIAALVSRFVLLLTPSDLCDIFRLASDVEANWVLRSAMKGELAWPSCGTMLFRWGPSIWTDLSLELFASGKPGTALFVFLDFSLWSTLQWERFSL